HVEDDQVRKEPLGLAERVLAVLARRDLEAFRLEVQRHDRPHAGVVVGEQHAAAATADRWGQGERSECHDCPTTIPPASLENPGPPRRGVRRRSHWEACIPLRAWDPAVRSAPMRRPVIMLVAAVSLVLATAAPSLGARAGEPAAVPRATAVALAN